MLAVDFAYPRPLFCGTGIHLHAAGFIIHVYSPPLRKQADSFILCRQFAWLYVLHTWIYKDVLWVTLFISPFPSNSYAAAVQACLCMPNKHDTLTRCWAYVGTTSQMLGRRRRRRTSIGPIQSQCLMFTV